jgi:hypothetical protein
MRQIQQTVIAAIFASFTASTALAAPASDLTAFPGAEGFGQFAKGGRGGRVIKVTNLNDAGAGSLRAAVEAEGPRIVVFDVGGVIRLKSDLKIANDYITIAGQTAPGYGVTLRDGQFLIHANHVIVRYLRSRVGDEAGKEMIRSRSAAARTSSSTTSRRAGRSTRAFR